MKFLVMQIFVAFCCFSSSYNAITLSVQFSNKIISNYTYHLLKHKQNLHFFSEILLCNLYDPHKTETSFPSTASIRHHNADSVLYEVGTAVLHLNTIQINVSPQNINTCSCRVNDKAGVIICAVLHIRILIFTISASSIKYKKKIITN